eukprot:1471537-Alexandrium_andersonii.AAC.1
MSASLVGSEMCIRDSSVVSRPEHAAGCQQTGCAGPAPGQRLGLLAAGAVSYTHLTLPTICSV